MKKLIISATLLLAGFTLIAQEGIQFTDASWEEVLQQAGDNERLIFLDAYTTWCGPCKMMEKNVFTEKAVGDFFNEKFINVRMDMEKEAGVQLAEKYGVKAYPTLLFINGEGKVIHRASGYHNAPLLIDLGRTALDPSRRLSSFEKRYQAGERSPEFLHDYAMASLNAMSEGQEVLAREYLQTQDDWSTPKNMRFIFTFVEEVQSDLFRYLAKHRPAFEDQFGAQAVITRIQQLILKEAFSESSEKQSLEKVDSLFRAVYPEVGGQLSGLFRMNFYQYNGNTEQYARAAVRYFEEFSSEDAAQLNNAAWNFYETVEDESMLEKAVQWAQKSVQLDAQYYNHDTLAALYFKLGEKDKALIAAQKAIEIAKENGENYSNTEILLEKIKGL